LGAGELAVLAAVGRGSVAVHPRPRVAVLSTGAELVEPGSPIGPGQIWESNSYMLTAAALDEGCSAFRRGFVGDDPATVMETIEDSLLQADIVLTTGGVSMGAYDVVKEVLSHLGTVHFDKVAMQPGMPQGAGTVGESAAPILTLPGNPVSSYVSFQLFVRPVLRRMRGLPPDPLPSVHARLTAPVPHSPEGRRSYLRAVLEYDGSEGPTAYTARTAMRQGSHQLSALAEANALVVVPEAVTELAEGSVVEVMQLPAAT
ncbi:gephyrin-like molybdotransferase Glp, partial [Streptomonospora algeriensis]